MDTLGTLSVPLLRFFVGLLISFYLDSYQDGDVNTLTPDVTPAPDTHRRFQKE